MRWNKLTGATIADFRKTDVALMHRWLEFEKIENDIRKQKEKAANHADPK